MDSESVRYSGKQSFGMQRRSTRGVSLIWTALVVLACAGSAGPVGKSDFEATLRRSIDLDDETIELSGAGMWYRDTRGSEEIREAAKNLERPDMLEGALVLTDSRLVLVEWADDHYEQLMSLPYTEILASELEKYGRNRMLIIRWHRRSWRAIRRWPTVRTR